MKRCHRELFDDSVDAGGGARKSNGKSVVLVRARETSAPLIWQTRRVGCALVDRRMHLVCPGRSSTESFRPASACAKIQFFRPLDSQEASSDKFVSPIAKR